MNGRSLAELAVRREGVMGLGVARVGGSYVGVPKGGTVIRAGDRVVLYSATGLISELDRRRMGAAGDAAHARLDGAARSRRNRTPPLTW